MTTPKEPWRTWLSEIADRMERRHEDNRTMVALADHLRSGDTEHSPSDHGECDSCRWAGSDSPWPCADWLELMSIGVEWLLQVADESLPAPSGLTMSEARTEARERVQAAERQRRKRERDRQAAEQNAAPSG